MPAKQNNNENRLANNPDWIELLWKLRYKLEQSDCIKQSIDHKRLIDDDMYRAKCYALADMLTDPSIARLLDQLWSIESRAASTKASPNDNRCSFLRKNPRMLLAGLLSILSLTTAICWALVATPGAPQPSQSTSYHPLKDIQFSEKTQLPVDNPSLDFALITHNHLGLFASRLFENYYKAQGANDVLTIAMNGFGHEQVQASTAGNVKATHLLREPVAELKKHMLGQPEMGYIGLAHHIPQDNPYQVAALIGYDALVFITSAQNPIQQLSLEQLTLLFSGYYQNWQSIGSFHQPVTLVASSREDTLPLLNQQVIRPNYYWLKEDIPQFSNRKLIEYVSTTPGAIGVALASELKLDANVNLLKISYFSEQPGVKPDINTLGDDSYPISLPIVLALPSESYQGEQLFDHINATKTDVEAQHFFPPTITFNSDYTFPRTVPNHFRQRVQKHKKLNLRVSLTNAKRKPDVISIAKLNALKNYLENEETRNTIFVGHSDAHGTFDEQYYWGMYRARLLAELLDDQYSKTLSFASTAPLATNEKGYGRRLNRRVEIWAW
ncbi:MAG: hypothetical protein CMF25_01365 [Kangiellaceae bacterium]|nr:hypothetical protein [Kangiellaceae bacterium]